MIWYGKHQRDLPWRKTGDPYAIWVSEVMLQQTQVKTVVPYYEKFIGTFPDVCTLANADLQQILKSWEGLGYYARARNLHRASIHIVKSLDGKIPDAYETLRKLPGVGDYIASAVSSIAFGHPFPVVDGNVKRVLSRFLMMEHPVNKPDAHAFYKISAEKLLDQSKPGLFNQAMMELGALICKPGNPICTDCPVRNWCAAFKNGAVDLYPRRLRAARTPEYHIAVGVIFKNNRVLITQRKPDGLLGGLWEFPGGKVRQDETAEQACIREIREEVNLEVCIHSFVTRVNHAYTHFRIKMDVFICTFISGRVRLGGSVDFKWIGLGGIKRFPLPRANLKFIPELLKLKPENACPPQDSS